jgi:hypothetical protein
MRGLIRKLRNYQKPVVGIGVTAFTRTGPAFLLPHYQIIALLETADLIDIRKVVPVYSLEKTLGKHSKTFRKGLICESQGYGVGAFAYYRRITEEIIDELLASIADLIEVDNKEQYLEALEKTKQTRVTQEKIDLLP